MCQLSIQKCRDNCGNNNDCADLCAKGKQCGAKDPRRVNITTTIDTTAPTSTAYGTGGNDGESAGVSGGPSPTGTDDPQVVEDDPFNNGASGFGSGSAYGAGVLAAAIAIGFLGIL